MESHPRVYDLQHPRLCKSRRGLQIMVTRQCGDTFYDSPTGDRSVTLICTSGEM